MVADTARYGRLDAESGRIMGFIDKGMTGPGLINAGCYVFPREILNTFPKGESFSIENDFLAKAVGQQRFDLFITNGHFIDIGVPFDYERAQVELA